MHPNVHTHSVPYIQIFSHFFSFTMANSIRSHCSANFKCIFRYRRLRRSFIHLFIHFNWANNTHSMRYGVVPYKMHVSYQINEKIMWRWKKSISKININIYGSHPWWVCVRAHGIKQPRRMLLIDEFLQNIFQLDGFGRLQPISH